MECFTHLYEIFHISHDLFHQETDQRQKFGKERHFTMKSWRWWDHILPHFIRTNQIFRPVGNYTLFPIGLKDTRANFNAPRGTSVHLSKILPKPVQSGAKTTSTRHHLQACSPFLFYHNCTLLLACTSVSSKDTNWSGHSGTGRKRLRWEVFKTNLQDCRLKIWRKSAALRGEFSFEFHKFTFLPWASILSAIHLHLIPSRRSAQHSPSCHAVVIQVWSTLTRQAAGKKPPTSALYGSADVAGISSTGLN